MIKAAKLKLKSEMEFHRKNLGRLKVVCAMLMISVCACKFAPVATFSHKDCILTIADDSYCIREIVSMEIGSDSTKRFRFASSPSLREIQICSLLDVDVAKDTLNPRYFEVQAWLSKGDAVEGTWTKIGFVMGDRPMNQGTEDLLPPHI